MQALRRVLCSVYLLWPLAAAAQEIRGVVVDQTGLPLPGAVVELRDAAIVQHTITTGNDGTFEFSSAQRGDVVTARLEGFETVTVPRIDAARIVLPVAHATDTTDVVASLITATTPTSALLGSTLSASTVARMPSSRLKARESLPLLPSVLRGPSILRGFMLIKW